MNLTIEDATLPAVEEMATEDKWILTRYNETVKTVNASLESFEVGVALSTLYDFTWDVFCDWYIELAKARLNDKESAGNIVAQKVLCHVLTGILKLLHPFMPFITEEIYQSLPHSEDEESIMISRYPDYDEALTFPDDTERMNVIIDAIRAIRNRRSEMNVVPSRRAKVYIATSHPELFPEVSYVFFQRLASASEVEAADTFEGKLNADETVQIVTSAATILLPLSDIIDLEKEKARLTAEQKKLEGEIARLAGKLSNEGFVAKAPAAVVEAEKVKLEKYRENLAGVITALEKMK